MWIAIDLTIIAVLFGVMAIAIAVAAIVVAKKVGAVGTQIQTQVKEVCDKAHAVIDQTQKTVGSVTGKIEQVEKIVSGVGSALVGARVAHSARSLAKNSADIAGSVLLGIRAGMDTLLRPRTNGRGNKDG